MTRKPTPERNAAAGSSLADALDRLYAAPLERFVPLRRELAAALRAQGEAPASRLVASAGKPTRAAWALNQVVRDDPRRVVALFEAWDAAADAQARGDAAAMRATARAYRDRAGELTQAVRDRTAKAGAELGAAQLRQVGATLQAASAGGDDGRAKLLRARLTRHVELDDPFEGIPLEGAHAPAQPGAATGRSEARAQPAAHRAPGATAQARAESAERKRAQAAAERAALREREERRRRIEEARAAVTALEREARDRAATARRVEAEAERAREKASEARDAANDAAARLERARGELAALEPRSAGRGDRA